jgi:hypothetical protein
MGLFVPCFYCHLASVDKASEFVGMMERRRPECRYGGVCVTNDCMINVTAA